MYPSFIFEFKASSKNGAEYNPDNLTIASPAVSVSPKTYKIVNEKEKYKYEI